MNLGSLLFLQAFLDFSPVSDERVNMEETSSAKDLGSLNNLESLTLGSFRLQVG